MQPESSTFPVPDVHDEATHVYLSVGHQQMMTDAMRPLGLSVWQLTAGRPMHVAGGRLFVDVTQELASPAGRARLVEGFGKADPLMGDALRTVIDRDLVPLRPDDGPVAAPPGPPPPPLDTDPGIVTDLIAGFEASLAAATRTMARASGSALLDLVLADVQELKRLLFDPRSHQVLMAGFDAAWWLNDRLQEWLGETNAADVLSQSLDRNVTSEMGLALLDVADVIRPHPAVVDALRRHVEDDGFLDAIVELDGGRDARDAITAWLDRFGMRGVGEIDITRPRWRERPATVLPMILTNVDRFGPGEGRRRFDAGRRAAAAKEADLLTALRATPGGEERAEETKAMIDRVRTFAGYREYPKYAIVCRYSIYKQALLGEAARLVRAGLFDDQEDCFFLTVDELADVVRTQRVDRDLIERRRADFRSYEALTPPRVLVSDGEALGGAYRRTDLPDGALVGLAVSTGTVEGRARVLHDVAEAELEPGDILVTTHTDPSWTPAFVAIAGLVTEVGGQMTHGAVIAREYGLPAVVGVEHATQRIADGQRIRVDGTDGYVELLG